MIRGSQLSDTIGSPIVNTFQFRYYFIVLMLFVSTWLISNISAIKLVSVFGIPLTGGFIVFPFTVILGSILVEVYGYKYARQAIWSGFILNTSFIFFINLVNIIPSSPHWNLDQQFKNILVPETRIITASLFSFLLSDFSNSYLMAKMKIRDKGKSLLKRIIISSFLSLTIDIFCFILLAFYDTMPTSLLKKLLIAAFFKKLICQILLFPLIIYLIEILKKFEGIDVYDFDTKFNPFSIEAIYTTASLKNTEQLGEIISFSQKIKKEK